MAKYSSEWLKGLLSQLAGVRVKRLTQHLFLVYQFIVKINSIQSYKQGIYKICCFY